ncbi:MAG: protoheme IX farnesyltransferase [Gammaproteobacteria bacterium]|nr:protoheme IX farnesyltransferase [Gammaproteobacteria bacterium]
MSFPAESVEPCPRRTDLWRTYFELTKPKVVLLIVFTAIVGMCLATQGMVPLDVLVFGTLGIGLAAASGAAFNHVADSRIDALMARTNGRPLPTGSLNARAAVIFASGLTLSSAIILVAFINTLTAVLTFLSMVGYSVVYTVYLKRATPQNIVIGGAAGAMPPVLGWAAVTGTVHPHALLLFALVFTWTPPHFWALAIHRHQDYARADIPMLPVTHGIPYTRLQILLYTVLMVFVSLLPFATQMSGLIYLIGAIVLGALFLWEAWKLYVRPADHSQPMRTFAYSIWYLTAMFTLLLADHYLLM